MASRTAPIAAALAALGMLGCGTQAHAAKWSAIAYSETKSAYGKTWSFGSQADAESRALAECAKHASDCKIVGTVTSADAGPEVCLGLAEIRVSIINADDKLELKLSPVTATHATRDGSRSAAVDQCMNARSRLLMGPNPPEVRCRFLALTCTLKP